MTLYDVVDQIGANAFQTAAESAWQVAASKGPIEGEAEEQAQARFDILSDAVEMVMDGEEQPQHKMELLFELYRNAPSFTIVDQVFVHYWRELPTSAKQAFWREIRKVLAQPDDRLAWPVEYLLWVDFFETSDEVADAWAAVTAKDVEDEVIKRVLPLSGPVPFGLKRRLFERLLPEKEWHALIYESVLQSAFDYYGDITAGEARSILERLNLEPHEMPEIDKLERRLLHLDEMRERMRSGEHVEQPDQFYAWLNAADAGEDAEGR